MSTALRSAREQFFLGDPNRLHTPSPGTPLPYAFYPVTSGASSASSNQYRFASIDRLANRSGIYDATPPLPSPDGSIKGGVSA